MRERILRELIENRGSFISGQEISRKYDITRANVWKYIRKLKESGYEIESVTNKGYRLLEMPDSLDMIYLDFDKDWIIGREYIYLDEVDSTNEYAKKIASEKPDGAIVLAENQYKGKGRLGREWTSLSQTGIWMSLILKPEILPADAIIITQVAAAAVVKGITEILDCEVKIKWPNDIVLKNKKICGILTEFSGEIESINYIIVGIGINVNQKSKDFPEEIRDKAGSLREYAGKEISRKLIVKEIINYFNKYYFEFLKNQTFKGIIDICKKYSATLQNEVRIIQNGKEIIGKAVDLTDRGTLIIEDSKGVKSEIISGEVSVRGLYHYVD